MPFSLIDFQMDISLEYFRCTGQIAFSVKLELDGENIDKT